MYSYNKSYYIILSYIYIYISFCVFFGFDIFLALFIIHFLIWWYIISHDFSPFYHIYIYTIIHIHIDYWLLTCASFVNHILHITPFVDTFYLLYFMYYMFHSSLSVMYPIHYIFSHMLQIVFNITLYFFIFVYYMAIIFWLCIVVFCYLLVTFL